MPPRTVQVESRLAYDCFRMATTGLELAKRAKEEWEIEYHLTTGITFIAFSFEAMINHFALIYFNDWDKPRLERKKAHKKLFEAVNLPHYLGTTEYQVAQKSFELRDLLAHGKTTTENLPILPSQPEPESQFIIQDIVKLASTPFREATPQLLHAFIENVKKVESDIQQNGFYPNQDDLPDKYREHLCESPLRYSGIRTW